jgi:two-component system, NarL family, sensor histidine kinase LiaS
MMLLLKRFSTLRWKLVFSYVGVTLATVLTLEAIFVLLMAAFGRSIGDAWTTQSALTNAEQLAQLAAGPLETGEMSQLTHVLYQPMGLVFMFGISEGASKEYSWYEPRVVINHDGLIVASNQPERYLVGSRFQEPQWPQAEILIEQALANESAATDQSEALNMFAVAMPILGSQGQPLGVLYYQQSRLSGDSWSPVNLAQQLAVTTLLLLPCMIPLGLVFGFVTALGFTRRLNRLAQASHAVANGNLAQRVQDTSGDELGQLSRQFNRMAAQLETDTIHLHELAERNARLAQQAQKLAALEERHRLARDLHDGIKQNLFGVNLAIATALNLLKSNTEAAGAKLLEAKEHSLQAQAEMQILLNELRPAGLDERGLVAALEDYLAAFERRQNIKVTGQLVKDLSLPPTHEQALYRVAQEALTNVAHHAHATQVLVEIEATAETVTLCISDNGQGFDPAAIKPGVTLGLQGMRERLSELNGNLTIVTDLGKGTQVTAGLPRPHSDESR